MESTEDDWDDDAVIVVVPPVEAAAQPHESSDNLPMARDRDFIAAADKECATVPPVTPVTPVSSAAVPPVLPKDPPNQQEDSPAEKTGVDSLLAAAIQNTMHIRQQQEIGLEEARPPPSSSSSGETAVKTQDDAAITTRPHGIVEQIGEQQSSIKQEHQSATTTSPSAAAGSAESATAQKNENAKKEEANNNTSSTTSKPPPSYWKLAGRAIKKHKAGKIILNGIRDGYDGTKRTLGIGVGQILICLAEQKVYRPEETVKGTVQMELTEPIAATRLVIGLQGVRRESSAVVVSNNHGGGGGGAASTRKNDRQNVHRFDYDISGAQEYPCQGQFPFEVVIPPRLQRQMSPETRNTLVGSLVSSVQTLGAAMQNPIEWSLTATLIIPGRVNVSKTIPIHVADDEY